MGADVTVIVVGYNSLRFIDDCLDSVADAAGELAVDTVVVDNASLDFTADHVRAAWPYVTVIDAGWNSGFSRACNLGVAASDSRYILFLNSDAALEPRAIATMAETLDADADIGIVAPRVLNADRSDQQTARSFPTAAALIWGRRSPLSRRFPNNRYTRAYLMSSKANATEPFAVDWVSGAALMVDRALLEEVSGLSEKYFMYWEDADICRQVRGLGRTVWCVPAATAVHLEGGSAGVTAPVQNQRFHRSAYRYAADHHLNGWKRPLRPALAALLAARCSAVAASRWRRGAEAPEPAIDLTDTQREPARAPNHSSTRDPANASPSRKGNQHHE